MARKKAAGEENGPGDVDREVYSLQRYLELLAEGQTVALDMLFAPDAAMTRTPSPGGGPVRYPEVCGKRMPLTRRCNCCCGRTRC